MTTISIVRLTLVFAVVFSLTAFSGSMLSGFTLPSIPVVRANPAPCSTAGSPCSANWVPAGPAMDTLLNTIFTDENAEFVNIQTASPSIDFTDWPLTPDLLSGFTTNSNFYITSQISEHGYFEIQFMLGASAFWGCNMNFGNSQCGIDIRQGISHLIDKTKFTSPVSGEPTIRGISSAIDNPLPTSNGGLPSPNPCAWDNGVVPAVLQPVLGTSLVQSGSSCTVGAVGGTAYHLASASGVGTPNNWQPSISDLDMCAAAAHFIDAGLATGVVNPSTNPSLRNCQLTGITTTVTANAVTFFVRSDNTPRLDLGDSLAQVICALFTGVYSTGCGVAPSTTNILNVQHGPITAFTGFTTSTDHIDVSWHMYTAAFGNVFPFDSSLYLGYNSLFVSGVSALHQSNGGTCSNNSVPTASAGNYMYLCNSNYDALSNSMEFANCLTAEVGTDPQTSQSVPTFGTCTAGHGGGLSAVSAGYQAEDAFGQKAFTFPIFQQADQFGYLACSPAARPCSTNGLWQRGINHFGNGLANTFTWLNAWNNAPAVPNTLRQGFKQTTRTTSPYIASTVWDFYVVGNIYDSLHIVNPLNNAEDLSWMDISALPQTSLTYAAPAGTVLTYRFTLMPNLNWQDGKPVTSFDVAFSYLSLLANGAFQSGGAASLAGVTILSPTQFDLNVNSVGPFTRLFLTGVTIMPGRYWTCGGTQPSTGIAPNILPAPCPIGSANWDNGIARCTRTGNNCYPVQYSLGTAPTSANCYPNSSAPCAPPAQCVIPNISSAVPCPNAPVCPMCGSFMNADATKTGPLYDPIASHILIGSGAWTCGTGAGLGQNCAPANIQNPGTGQSYTLQRNGLGAGPGFPGDYFRSSGFLASWLWSGDITSGVTNFSTAKACFGVAPVPLGPVPPPNSCAHWQQGIGTNGATLAPGVGGCPGAPNTSLCGIPVGSNQVSITKLYININWVYPDVWNSASPPNGIIALDPVLYSGSAGTLSPATGTGSVGCASAYPAGGYDC